MLTAWWRGSGDVPEGKLQIPGDIQIKSSHAIVSITAQMCAKGFIMLKHNVRINYSKLSTLQRLQLDPLWKLGAFLCVFSSVKRPFFSWVFIVWNLWVDKKKNNVIYNACKKNTHLTASGVREKERRGFNAEFHFSFYFLFGRKYFAAFAFISSLSVVIVS